jgi:hypothetical protein
VLTCEVESYDSLPLAVTLDLYGNGPPMQRQIIYTTAPSHPLIGIGDWLTTLGAAVSYPTSTRMTANLPRTLTPDRVYFMASEFNDVADTLVTYSFDAK